MKLFRTYWFCFVLCLFIVFEHTSVLAQEAKKYSANDSLILYVKGIEGKDHDGRGQYIKDRLNEFRVGFTTMPFDTVLVRKTKNDTIQGENIIVRLGTGRQRIVVGAHYDAVPGSPGANDNGGGVAVLLELIRHFKNKSLNHSIDFCFFDQEEEGLIGSAVYVQRYDSLRNHLAMINLDVEGSGDNVYVGPVGGGDDDRIMKYVHQARDTTKYVYTESEYYPGSDHESFGNAKLENISVSVVPDGDAEKLIRWVQSGFKSFEKAEDVPDVLKVMHSPEDKSEYVTASALMISYEFVLTTLLLLDAGEK